MSKEQKILFKYLDLMYELRKREEIIVTIHKRELSTQYNIVDFEFIIFQLRKIIELIAMAPIIINESEYREISKKAQYDWRLRDIIKKLENVNPNFFPKPVEPQKTDTYDVFAPIKSGFLTKEELCDVYDYCSSFLHFRNPLQANLEIDFNKELKYILEILRKIHILLNTHICHPCLDDTFFYIMMERGNNLPGGNVFKKVSEEEKEE